MPLIRLAFTTRPGSEQPHLSGPSLASLPLQSGSGRSGSLCERGVIRGLPKNVKTKGGSTSASAFVRWVLIGKGGKVDGS